MRLGRSARHRTRSSPHSWQPRKMPTIGFAAAAITALGLVQLKALVDRQDVRPAIAAAMNDESLHVRESGMYAFWATAGKAPDFPIALLHDADVRTRRSAVNALARSAPLARVVIPELIVALTDQDAAVCAGGTRLGNIWPPPQAARPALHAHWRHHDAAVREAAATALAGLDDAEPMSGPNGPTQPRSGTGRG